MDCAYIRQSFTESKLPQHRRSVAEDSTWRKSSGAEGRFRAGQDGATLAAEFGSEHLAGFDQSLQGRGALEIRWRA